MGFFRNLRPKAKLAKRVGALATAHTLTFKDAYLRATPIVVLVSLLFALNSSAAQRRGNAQEPQPTKDLTAAELFAKDSKAVVIIETPTAQGSGVIVESAADFGLIVTNLHVIVSDNSAVVKLPDGRSSRGVWVAAVDPYRDLAILRVNLAELPSVALGNLDGTRVGDQVFAIGAPEGLELSLSNGIVSAIRDSDDGNYRVVQTTAAISHGSSGGGLFNTRGELLGITTYKIRGGENLNFAIPVNYVRGLMAESGTTLLSLADVHSKYDKTESVANTTPAVQLPAPQPPPSSAPAFPRLSVSYHSTRSGGRLLVSQRGDTATITIYNSSYYIIGHAAVTWSSRLEAFVGDAEITYVCGPIDTRTIPITTSIGYHPQPGGVLRELYSRVTKLNCDKRQFDTTVTEDQWWPQ